MDGLSLQWYEAFLSDPVLRESLFASLQIATVTMVIGTILGTMLAIGLVRSRARWSPGLNILMLIPLVTPEIVAGISALLIFWQLGVKLSIFTVMLAHITFSISYVAIVVRGRLATMGSEAEEAAMDLGATRLGSVRLVLLPGLWPAIVAAGLLVFALSFDDFVLSFFTTGDDVQPLPVRVWSAIRFGVSPTINATGTLMMVVSLTTIALAVMLPRLFGRRESAIKVLTGQEGG
ncbi:MAG: ABC transporter permease [Actinobacteria bacterium]|nr:ABC transporter permease [Actinomycetota bacterium]